MTKKINVQIEANIHHSNTLIFRQGLGDAESPENGNKYELSLCNMSLPCVRSEKTGKWFIITWPALVDAAIAAGIDDEDDPA